MLSHTHSSYITYTTPQTKCQEEKNQDMYEQQQPDDCKMISNKNNNNDNDSIIKNEVEKNNIGKLITITSDNDNDDNERKRKRLEEDQADNIKSICNIINDDDLNKNEIRNEDEVVKMNNNNCKKEIMFDTETKLITSNNNVFMNKTLNTAKNVIYQYCHEPKRKRLLYENPDSCKSSTININNNNNIENQKQKIINILQDITCKLSSSSSETVECSSSSQQQNMQQIPLKREVEYNKLYNALHKRIILTAPIESSSSSEITRHSTINNNNIKKEANNTKIITKNGSILLLGLKGQGKTYVLEHVLKNLKNECNKESSLFHVVKLNAMTSLRAIGDDTSAVKCIIHQLSNIANSTKKENDCSAATTTTTTTDSASMPVRRAPFHSNLSSLNEVMERASIDKIPLLIIIDNIEYLASNNSSKKRSSNTQKKPLPGSISNKRQALLYHLLDKSSQSYDTLLTVIGITSRVDIFNMLEKRIKSRANGNNTHVRFNPYNYIDVIDILLCKMQQYKREVVNDNNDNDDFELLIYNDIYNQIKTLLSPPNHKDNSDNNNNSLYNIMYHNFRMGRGIRWFVQIMTFAIEYLIHDIKTNNKMTSSSFVNNHQDNKLQPLVLVLLTKHHFMRAINLEQNDSNSISNASATTTVTTPSSSTNTIIEQLSKSRTIQMLKECPVLQIAILLSARRILSRISMDHMHSSITASSYLTFNKIHNEFQQSYTKKNSGVKYPKSTFFEHFCNLLNIGLLNIVNDHTNGMAYQYYHNFCIPLDISKESMEDDNKNKSFVELNIIDEEFELALKYNLLDCPTSLKTWGLCGLQ